MSRWKLWLYGTLAGIAIAIPIMLVMKFQISLVGIAMGSALVVLFGSKRKA